MMSYCITDSGRNHFEILSWLLFFKTSGNGSLIAPDGDFVPSNLDNVGAIPTVWTVRSTCCAAIPGPANMMGTKVSYGQGDPWVQATIKPSKSLMKR